MKKFLLLLLLGFCSLQMNAARAQECPPADPNCAIGGNEGNDGPTVTVPEPSVLWLMAAGLAGFGVTRLVKSKKS